ncbi:MAG: hypothetical protein JJT90_01755 [Ectothiorhodospiraceae bacterium]|nr:hypothetical protein [Ectothiorhodospiraceae bacterium]
MLRIIFGAFALLCHSLVAATQNPDSERWVLDEDNLPFDSAPGLETETGWGTLDGAGYRWEIPEHWNGDLVIYARPLRSSRQPTLEVINPPGREDLLDRGFAWAASSFDYNGYHVQSGVDHSHRLLQHFIGMHPVPGRVYLVGHDLGGQVAAASAEQHPDSYDGVLALCAPLVDTALLDYLMAYTLAAKALAGIDARFPDPEFQERTRPDTLAALGPDYPSMVHPAGEELIYLHTRLAGGPHVLSDAAIEAWATLLFDFGHMDGSLGGLAPGNVIDTREILYRLPDPERAAWLNGQVLRLEPEPQIQRGGLEAIPPTTGEIGIPVLTVAALGDLYVPLSMQQLFAERVADAGRAQLLVQWVIRDLGHCTLTTEEEAQAFDALVTWVEDGRRPRGDRVRDPDAVAAKDFGCRHTRTDRPGLPAC